MIGGCQERHRRVTKLLQCASLVVDGLPKKASFLQEKPSILVAGHVRDGKAMAATIASVLLAKWCFMKIMAVVEDGIAVVAVTHPAMPEDLRMRGRSARHRRSQYRQDPRRWTVRCASSAAVDERPLVQRDQGNLSIRVARSAQ